MGETTSDLNLKQVAAELDVHYMTAYRYVRQGRLPATMLNGGWVVRAGDLRAFRSRSTPTPGAAGGSERVDRLRHLIDGGDEVGAWRYIDDLLAAGTTPQDCLVDLLPRALDVGDLHDADAAVLARSSVATATASRLVDRLANRHVRPGRSKGTVLLAAPTGEHHRLALATVAALVRIGGYRTLDLGTDVAPPVIAAAVGLRPVLAVGIGITTLASVDAAADAVARIGREHPDLPVVLGGQAVRNADVARLVGSRWWAPDGVGMVDLLDRVGAERRHDRRAGRAR